MKNCIFSSFVVFWLDGAHFSVTCCSYGADVAVRLSHTATSAPHTWPTQRLSRPPPIQKLGAENHMLQLNIYCSWWWAYVPEACRAKNTWIKLPCCIKLAFQIKTRRRLLIPKIMTVTRNSSWTCRNAHSKHISLLSRCYSTRYVSIPDRTVALV